MDRKKIIGIIFILAVLSLIGILIFKSFSLKKSNEQKSNFSQNLDAKPTNLIEKSKQKVQEETAIEAEFMGRVEIISEKTIIIKNPNESIVVNIKGTIPVMILDGPKQPVVGQMADLKTGDAVKIIYEKLTKNAVKISIIRFQMVKEAK